MQIQPATKANPPKGVMIPTQSRPCLDEAFNQVRIYNEPLKSIMPIKKRFPAHSIHLFEKSLKRIPAKARANTW